MGPRKSNATAAGKDDGTALGKMRKIIPTDLSIASNSKSNKTGTLPTKDNRVEIPYTPEEKQFLTARLAIFTAIAPAPNSTHTGTTTLMSGTEGNTTNTTVAPSGTTDFAALSREHWLASLPTLLSATQKALSVAAAEYQITCQQRTAAAQASSAANAGSPTGLAGQLGLGSSPDAGKDGLHHHHASITEAMMLNQNGLPPTGPRPTPAAGTIAQFSEENAYILAQAQQIQWCPFTYQRWLELLVDPGRCHASTVDGRLRGDVLQASLRRCILVTYPAVEGGDCF